MARRRIIAGNWKMNKTPSEAKALCAELKDLVKNDNVDVVYCVPAIDIVPVAEAVKGTNVHVGAENFYIEDKGAFTGEISAPMLKDAGVEYIIIGHSERRDIFGENDILINQKVKKAFASGLTPIMCCGESLALRKAGTYKEWIARQIKWDLTDVTADQVKTLVIAYEPIWAIGTGETATPEQAEEMCGHIRNVLADMYGKDTADKVIIQYGGSVKPENASELMAKPDIDGALVGGASLDPDKFEKIVNFD
jgi:triosephosphate isomerase